MKFNGCKTFERKLAVKGGINMLPSQICSIILVLGVIIIEVILERITIVRIVKELIDEMKDVVDILASAIRPEHESHDDYKGKHEKK